MTSARLGWYARRAARMSLPEISWRARDQALKAAWSWRHVSRSHGSSGSSPQPGPRYFAAVLPPDAAERVPQRARRAVLSAADRLIQGEWEIFGVLRADMGRPDWFYDPVTGRRAASDRYAFRINHRSEKEAGNVKQVWELSRLQHLTLLATAWFVSHEDDYARRAAQQLTSWWRENPFLSGIHWTSGIEVGLRLISFTWIRRLLHDWPDVADLFERSELAAHQIRWHQEYLAAFISRGSSANNHVVAEAVGQFVASCAFPWFRRSGRWREMSARLLERELVRNTFPSGIGRELASDYQAFVAELGLIAAAEAAAAGSPLSDECWVRVCAMIDSGAALLDERLRPPRQGDGDEGRALLLDAPTGNSWPSLLATGAALFGPLDWWPAMTPSVASTAVAALHGKVRPASGRPVQRPWRFRDAGTTLLRTTNRREPEIWCRCDGGPHGYLKIAAHAHADALSVEVRYGGVDILADPGTYCYHGEPAWRSYFRSTIAHNTIELDGRNQSGMGGPFLWIRHAHGRELHVRDIGDAVEWTAEHDGYLSLDPPARHRRCVRLDRASRTIDIVDQIDGASRDLRLAIHLGPDVTADLDGAAAMLSWSAAEASGTARMDLPRSLRWSRHRGETDPVLGWYSAGLGRRTPAITLLGCGRSAASEPLITRLEFLDTAAGINLFSSRLAVSNRAADALLAEKPTDSPVGRSASDAEAG